MYINRKSSLYASPRNELHVGNESSTESPWLTCFTAIIILAVLMALLLAFITFSSSSAMSLPMQAGTGECGYFHNVTTLHRNGLVDPMYCTSNTAEFSTDPFILHNASVQTDMPVVTVERADNTGTDETSTNDTVSTFEPASDVVVSNEPIVEPKQESASNEPDNTPAESVEPAEHNNNGHGNNVDGVDCSNPSGHTPHDKVDSDPNVDDESH